LPPYLCITDSVLTESKNQALLLEAGRFGDRPLQEGSRDGRKVERLQITGVFLDLMEARSVGASAKYS
jgi:hypothetical protein